MSLGRAIASAYSRSFQFSGLASRADYWWFVAWLYLVPLALLIGYAVAARLVRALGSGRLGTAGNWLLALVFLAALAVFIGSIIPGLALAFRRARTTAATRWRLAAYVLPLIGPLVLLFAIQNAGIGIGQCDGGVPRWMLPWNYSDSGCADLRQAWQANLPWNWGSGDVVCLGMCVPPR